MAFFGIGGSKKKKTNLSDGVIHDSRQDAKPADDILKEFEAQFGEGVPQPSERPHVPDTVEAAPSAPRPKPRALRREPHPVPHAPPSAPQPHTAPEPMRPVSHAPPLPPHPVSEPARPTHASLPVPGPKIPPASHAPPGPPASLTPQAPPPTAPSSLDLPDFDFDFHPSDEPSQTGAAPSAAQPRQEPEPSSPVSYAPPLPPHPVSEPARPTHASIPPQPPPQPHGFPTNGSSETPDPFDFDFTTPSAEPVHHERPVEHRARLHVMHDETMTPAFDEPEPAPEPPAPEPHRALESSYPSAFLRDGTLYIEKHSLVKRARDLAELRGLSESTSSQFSRIEALGKKEKKLIARVKSAIQNMHDTLEQTDQLLFTGD